MKPRKQARSRGRARGRPSAAARRSREPISRVFLSWSGEESRQVALALRDWIPSVLQSIEPWMSDQDIDAGTRWFESISLELNRAQAGIICLTPSNVGRVWLNFEAGAIAKHVSESFACPYLFRVEKAQLTGPLSLFQAVKADKEGTLKLVRTLNRATQRPLEERRLDEAVDTWWPKLEKTLQAIPEGEAPPPKRELPDMVEEILLKVRQLARERPFGYTTRAQAAALRSLGESALERVATAPGLFSGMTIGDLMRMGSEDSVVAAPVSTVAAGPPSGFGLLNTFTVGEPEQTQKDSKGKKGR